MNWLLRLYPVRWRERYGEEFRAVLASQPASVGLVLDVLAGAVDAHLYPQIHHTQIQQSDSISIQGDDTMTLAMFQRCAAGGPNVSRQDRCIASLYAIVSALMIAAVYLALTRIYRGAPSVQALLYASFPFTALVEEQTAYLRKRSWPTQAFVMGGGFLGIYLLMLAVCAVASKL
ncbi:MAG: hypothetical protein WCA16_06325 [Candidatus Sulfotelmatobacter sp.]